MAEVYKVDIDISQLKSANSNIKSIVENLANSLAQASDEMVGAAKELDKALNKQEETTKKLGDRLKGAAKNFTDTLNRGMQKVVGLSKVFWMSIMAGVGALALMARGSSERSHQASMAKTTDAKLAASSKANKINSTNFDVNAFASTLTSTNAASYRALDLDYAQLAEMDGMDAMHKALQALRSKARTQDRTTFNAIYESLGLDKVSGYDANSFYNLANEKGDNKLDAYFKDYAEQLKITSRVDYNAMKDLNREMIKFEGELASLAQTLGSILMPHLTKFVKWLNKTLPDALHKLLDWWDNGGKDSAKAALEGIASVLSTIGSAASLAWDGLNKLGDTLYSILDQFGLAKKDSKQMQSIAVEDTFGNNWNATKNAFFSGDIVDAVKYGLKTWNSRNDTPVQVIEHTQTIILKNQEGSTLGVINTGATR